MYLAYVAHPTPVTVYATSTMAPAPTLDDSTSSVVFYASIGGALGSVVVMATVVIVCYLGTSGNAKSLDSSPRLEISMLTNIAITASMH